MPERPTRLLRKGRPEVPAFEPQERLYRRFSPQQQVNSKFPGVSFSLPNCSINRGGSCPHLLEDDPEQCAVFSYPKDAIIDHPGFGVVSVGYDEVPASVVGGEGKNGEPGTRYDFRIYL